jgi:ADP-ribose pyrophosphatase
MSDVKVLDSRVLYEGKLKGIRETIETSDGRTFRHETILHPGAVVIAPVRADGRILFVEQYRHSVRKTILELPAGTLEPGEEPLVCARREITEEVGVQGAEWSALGELLPAPGFCNEIQYLFVAKGLSESKGTPDEDEIITVVSLSASEIDDSIRSGRLYDAKSIALITKARLLGVL